MTAANLFTPPGSAGQSWRDDTRVHPAADLFPMMSETPPLFSRTLAFNTSATTRKKFGRTAKCGADLGNDAVRSIQRAAPRRHPAGYQLCRMAASAGLVRR